MARGLGDVTPDATVKDRPDRGLSHTIPTRERPLCRPRLSGPQATDLRNVGVSQFGGIVRAATPRARRVSHVGVLFVHGGPAAIARGVGAVVVDAVKACATGTWPHVVVEGIERFSPARIDRDAAPTVAVIASLAGVETTLLHPEPDPILRGLSVASDGSGTARRAALRRIEQSPAGAGLATQTAARARQPLTQGIVPDRRARAAFADALPLAVLPWPGLAGIPQDEQSAESPAGDVLSWGHGTYMISRPNFVI